MTTFSETSDCVVCFRDFVSMKRIVFMFVRVNDVCSGYSGCVQSGFCVWNCCLLLTVCKQEGAKYSGEQRKKEKGNVVDR